MEDGAKRRDLEDRTFQFAESIRTFVKQLPRTISNTEDVRQLVRPSGSVAANWIEANEALSKKDFLMRVKICRKEAKESRLFLRLVDAGPTKSNTAARDILSAEARELVLIFSSIISKERMITTSCLGFGNWNLLGIWDLGFGAFRQTK
jgi:four helix bundle protein